MAWSRITGNQNQRFASGTTIAAAVSPGVVNRLIVVATGCDITTGTLSISDTAGNTWNALNPRKNQTGSGGMQSWYAFANGTGSTTVTCTSTVSAGFQNILIDVFDGNDTTASVKDNTIEASNSSGAPSASITPVNNDCLLWGAANDSITAVGSGFTKGADDTLQDWSEYKALTGGGGASQTVNFSGTSGAWIELVASFKPAGVGGGATIGGPCFDGRTFSGLTFGRVLGSPTLQRAA